MNIRVLKCKSDNGRSWILDLSSRTESKILKLFIVTYNTCQNKIYINREQNVHVTKKHLWVIIDNLQCNSTSAKRNCTELLVVKNTVYGSFRHWPVCAVNYYSSTVETYTDRHSTLYTYWEDCGRGCWGRAGPGTGLGGSRYQEKSRLWPNTISSEILTSYEVPSSDRAARW